MKRILINAAHNEEVRVALCNDNHLYDFDLENRTREQKKANIYKGRITRIEQSLEAVFVEYGSQKQGFLPLREIAPEYLAGNPREENIKRLLKEGNELIVQVEKEERGNKGAALSTYVSLAGRYLVLMPNNPQGGGISRQISGRVREEMRQIISSLTIPQGMSVIVRTAGIGRSYEELQMDLTHLLDTWATIQATSFENKAPILLHQEASVVTRAVRDYLRDDIGEVWIDNEYAYNEAAHFIAQVMPAQMKKLQKYDRNEPIFVHFGIERQIETAYQREVRLPSGGSIVIDQTEAMVAIDINSSKSTKGSDVAETAFHTNLEAADEIARQLRLRDMGGLIVIDFIDMADPKHQKEVEKRLIDATRFDRARVQFAEISKFGLLEMSRQRLRPSLDEATGYICPRCHGNGMIRDVRSLALSIMRQIEQLALQNHYGEIQVDVPTEIGAFLLNEKRESLVYLEQDTGVRITILPHAHLESPNFDLHFNPDGFAPATYERIVDVEKQHTERGYEANWQTQNQPELKTTTNHWQQQNSAPKPQSKPKVEAKQPEQKAPTPVEPARQPSSAVAWLSNLFAPKPQASLAHGFNNQDMASAIESIVNTGATSLGAMGQITLPSPQAPKVAQENPAPQTPQAQSGHKADNPRPQYNPQAQKRHKPAHAIKSDKPKQDKAEAQQDKQGYAEKAQKREPNSTRESRGEVVRQPTLTMQNPVQAVSEPKPEPTQKPKAEKELKEKTPAPKVKPEPKVVKSDEPKTEKIEAKAETPAKADNKAKPVVEKIQKSPDAFALHILPVVSHQTSKLVHLPLDGSKPKSAQVETVSVQDLPVVPETQVATPVSVAEPTDKPNDNQALALESQSQQALSQDRPNDLAQTATAETPVQELAQNLVQTLTQESPAIANPVTVAEVAPEAPSQIATENEPTTEVASNQGDLPTVSDIDESAIHESVHQSASEAVQETAQAVVAYFEPINHQTRHNRHTATPPTSVNRQVAGALAQSLSLVHNDPRVVLMALAHAHTPQPIKGTVGEFIRQTLPNGDELIAKDGVASAFIQAMNARPQAQTLTSFANYGYPAHSDAVWSAFVSKISTKGQYAISAGKTLATPPASVRAKNDPRGDKATPTPTPSDDKSGKQDGNALVTAQFTNAEPVNSTPVNTQSLANTLHQVANAQTDQELAYAVLGNTADRTIDSKGLTQTLMLALDILGKEVDKTLDRLDDRPNPQQETVSETTEQSTKPQKKDYKNMIEGIAEKLLPQASNTLLNISKPTAVKIKIRGKKNDGNNKFKVEIVRKKTANDSDEPSDS